MSSSNQWGSCDLTTSSVTLRSADGEHSVCVHLFGATVTSWQHRAREQLFLSSKSKFDQVKAIRGGIPVVFPQFGRPSETMSQHGFARTSIWSIEEMKSTQVSCVAIFLLGSSPETIAQWPHSFQLKYSVELSAQGLQCTLSATNTGDSPFQCHTLLHTYFRVPHISNVRIVGFQGQEYTDKVQSGKVFATTEEEVSFTGEVDRVYLCPSATARSGHVVPTPIPDIFIEDARTGEVMMRVQKAAVMWSAPPAPAAGAETGRASTTECVQEDCVLWNQWRDGSLGMEDMDDDGYEHYVCVEPGTVSEFVHVPPHATLSLSQTLVPHPPPVSVSRL